MPRSCAARPRLTTRLRSTSSALTAGVTEALEIKTVHPRALTRLSVP